MAQKSKLVEQTDWSGGVNAVTDPFLVTKKQVFRVRNLVLDEHGSLSTRDGYTVVTTSPDLVSPLVYRGALNTNNGSSFPFAIQNNGVVNTLRRSDTTPWSVPTTSATAYRIPQSVTIADVELFALGYETPKLWNGSASGFVPITAAAGQTLPTGANHLAFHLGSIWLWNTNAATTSFDGPSSLRMSDPNNPNSWPNANQTFIAKDDGQQGMGLSTFTIVETGISPTSTLVCFKNYSAYQVVGIFGSSNFAVQKVKSDMGCTAPRTIQFVSGFGIIRLTHKGFALFDGVNDRIISEEIRPYIFGHDDIVSLGFSSINLSYAAQAQNPPLYIAACPTASQALSRVFVYDLVRRAWTICDFPVNFQSLTLFTTSNAQPVVQAGTATGGQILNLFNGATDDNGTAIGWSTQTRTYFNGSFMRPTYWRRAVLDFEVRASQPVTVVTALGGVATSLTSTVTYATLAGTSSTYGTSKYGTAVYGASVITNARQSINILRTVPDVNLTISGTGFVRLRGLSLQCVDKRPTLIQA